MPERARTFLENQDFSRAINELDELACRDSAGKELAVRLYRTYRSKMLQKLRAWANDVLNWSRDHVLTSKGVAGEFLNLWSAMEQFENDYGINVDDSHVPSAVVKAQQILDEEKQVCRDAMKENFILGIEILLMDSYKKKYDKENKGEEWEKLSHAERVMRIRSDYGKNRKWFEKLFNEIKNSAINIQNEFGAGASMKR